MTPVQKGHGELVPVSGKPLRGEITIFAEGWIEVVAAAPGEEAGPKTRWLPCSQCAQVVWDKDLALKQAETSR